MKIYRNILLLIVYIRAVNGMRRVHSNSGTDIVQYNNGTVDNRSLSLPITSVSEPPWPKAPLNNDENITDGEFFSFSSFSLTIDNMYGSDTIQYSYGPSTYSSVFDASEQYMFNLMREATENFLTPINDRIAQIFDNGINLSKQFGGGSSSKDYIPQGNYTDANHLIQDDTKKELSIHQLATVDIDNLSSTSEIDYSYNQSNDTHLYTAKQGFLIDKVTKSDEVLWNSEDYDNVYSNKVWVGINDNNERIFRVYFPGEPPKLQRPVQPKPPQPKPVQPKPPQLKRAQLKPLQHPKHKLTKPNPITLDIKIKKTTSEVKYEYDKGNRIHTFTPLPGFLIDRVLKGSHQIWERENGVYPEKVMILPDEKGEMVVRIYFPKPVEPLPLREPETLLKLTPLSSRKLQPLLGETEYDHRLPVDLDVKMSQSTEFFKHVDKASVSIFIPNDNYVFGKIKELEDVGDPEHEISIWDPTNSEEYSYRVEYDKIYYFITVYLVNGTKKEFKKVHRQWVDYKHYRSSEIVPISLNIKYRNCCAYFEYFESGNVETYIPVEGYLFRLVKAVTGFTFFGSDVVIWKTDEPEKYSDKVEIIDNDTVIIYSVNGKVLSYKKGKDNEWPLEKEFTVDRGKSDGYKFVDLDINEQTVPESVQFSLSIPFISYHMESRTYRTKIGYKFNRVRDGDTTIWETIYDKSSATKVTHCKYFNTTLQRVFITLVDGTEKVFEGIGYSSLNRSWNELI